jgi:hypothetical protein
MLKSFYNKTRAALIHGMGVACLYTGAALVAVAVSAILLPFVLGLACLLAAHWLATRETEESVPAGVSTVVV